MWKLKLYEIEITHTHTHTHTLHPIPTIDHPTDELSTYMSVTNLGNKNCVHESPHCKKKNGATTTKKNKTKMRTCGAENN